MHAGADALVSAHGTGVYLGGALFTACLEHGLFLSGGLHDGVQFLLLGCEVFPAYGEAVFDLVKGGLLLSNLHAGVRDGLFIDLTKEVLVFDFLVQGVVLAGVLDGLQLTLILLDDALMLCDGELCIGNVAVELVHDCGDGGAALLQVCNLFLEGCNLCGEFSSELDYLVNL